MRELNYKRFPNICTLVNYVNKNKIKRENVQYVNIKEDGSCEILYWEKTKENVNESKKPLLINGRMMCPNCKANKNSLGMYCDNCGQVIDWPDEVLK